MKSIAIAESDLAARLLACYAARKRDDVVHSANEHLTDLIGVMLAGARHPSSLRLLSDMTPAAARRGATAGVVGHAACLPVQDAALFNAFAGHVHDFDDDDTLMSLSHPSVTTGAACLALSEAHGLPGRALVNAYIAGVELIMRLGPLVNPRHYLAGWHATCTLGVVGSAAASGLLLGLTAEQLRHALGFAASMAAGLRSNFGSDAKPLQTALAASHGVRAARLAALDMTSTPGSLLGPSGLVGMFAGDGYDGGSPCLATDGTGALFDPGVTIKAYPSCTCTHAAIALLQDIMATERVAASQIAAIDAWLDPAAPQILIHERATTALEAKFSLPFCLSLAACNGRLGLDDFTDAAVRRPDVVALAGRVRTLADETLPPGGGGLALGCRLQLTTHDGTQHRRFSEVEPGSKRWRLSRRQLEDKFTDCARHVLAAEDARALFAALSTLDRLDDIGALCGRLRPAGAWPS